MRFGRSSKTKGLLFIVAALVTGFLAVSIVLSVGSKMAPSVPALEAVRDIKMGTPLDRSMFQEVKLAEASLPSQMVDPNIDFTGLVAAKDISVGDILREPAILSLEGSPALFSARLRALGDPNLRAVEVPTGSVEGLITGMAPNDRVDLIAVYEEIEPTEHDIGVTFEKNLVTKTIIKGAPVLGVKTEGAEIEDGEATMLVVALTPEQVEELAYYRTVGTIYAALRPFGENFIDEEVEEAKEPENEKEEKVQEETEKKDYILEKVGDVEDSEEEGVQENLGTPVTSTEESIEEKDDGNEE